MGKSRRKKKDKRSGIDIEIERLQMQNYEEQRNKNYENAIKLLFEAWDKIPNNKYEYPLCYSIIMNILSVAIDANYVDIMLEWVDKIFYANLDRFDDGDRELWAGRVAYETGDKDKALEYFKVAVKKSGGRCFYYDEDMKYKQFLLEETIKDKDDQEIKLDNMIIPKKYEDEEYEDMELDDEIYEEIVELSDKGNELMEDGEFNEAMEVFKKALNLIPEPKDIWEASTWVYAALGDASFFSEDYEAGLNYMFEALKCPDGIGNPFILLRIGQCFFELDNIYKAKEYLLQAYMLEGEEIFEVEDDKYFKIVENLI